MKKSKITLFAFRPEHYRQMEAYLNEMMASGWKLRWCRGLWAGFEPAGEKVLHYAVDPAAMTNLVCFRRYPKRMLQERMQEGWYAAGKSKGCQILATEDPELELPVSDQELGPMIKTTCRLASLIWVLALLILGWWFFSKSAVVYSVLLTNIFLIFTLTAAFLLLYHGVNAILLTTAPGTPANPRVCKRYLVHDAGLLAILITAIVLETSGRNDMLLYLMIPILVIAAGMLFLSAMSGPKRNINRLSLMVGVISVFMLFMIVFLNDRMSVANADWTSQQQEFLLAQADELPVLRLSDFGDQEEPQQAVKTNVSILGSNLLYAEESGAGYIFTNYTVMKSPALTGPIFDYLYQQAQTDFGETFERDDALNAEFYVLEKARSGLFRTENVVCLFTVPEDIDVREAAEALLAQEAQPLS